MDILSILYSVSGLIFGAAFVPQILTLARDHSGAVSTSISTWLVFSLCNLVSLSYACTHSHDVCFIFCTTVGAMGNITVLVLACLRRIQFKVSPLLAPASAISER
jgi:lipid-A-disaccharide synthase-like uncharacterized protein